MEVVDLAVALGQNRRPTLDDVVTYVLRRHPGRLVACGRSVYIRRDRRWEPAEFDARDVHGLLDATLDEVAKIADEFRNRALRSLVGALRSPKGMRELLAAAALRNYQHISSGAPCPACLASAAVEIAERGAMLSLYCGANDATV
jgi:hypothetical protein